MIRFEQEALVRITQGALLAAVLALVGFLSAPPMRAQAPAGRPEFDVASIRLNKDCGTRRGGSGPPNPGRLVLYCWTVRDLIGSAYVMWASGAVPNPQHTPILGGPAWAATDLYDIEAKTESDAPLNQMYGPMLQKLLERRFKLKIHSETKELPVYALALAGKGMKLTPSKEQSCIEFDVNRLRQQIAEGESPKFCGRQVFGRRAGNVTADAYGMTMNDFCQRTLSARVDRPVIDRTGVSGRFDFHLEFSANPLTAAPEPGAPELSDSNGPSVFVALQEQLGLKLERAKGPVQVLVIDQVERPSSN